MQRLFLLGLCGGITWLAWRWLGPVAIAICAPLFGITLANPILALLGASGRITRQLAWRRIEGRHFEHRGIAIDIVADDADDRWLRVDDVRKLIPHLPAEATLRQLLPGGVRRWQRPDVLRIDAEALASYLSKSTEPQSLKFRNWLDREVLFPARRRKRMRP